MREERAGVWSTAGSLHKWWWWWGEEPWSRNHGDPKSGKGSLRTRTGRRKEGKRYARMRTFQQQTANRSAPKEKGQRVREKRVVWVAGRGRLGAGC